MYKRQYQYFFNAAHQLSAVKKFPDDTEQDLYEYEIIRYVDNTSVGLGFTNYGLNSLSECIYRGNQIQSYCNGLYEFPSCRIQELEKECYQYENNRLISADMYVFIPSIGYLSRMSYPVSYTHLHSKFSRSPTTSFAQPPLEISVGRYMVLRGKYF